MKVLIAFLSIVSISLSSLSSFAGTSANSISGVTDKIDSYTNMTFKIEIKNNNTIEITQLAVGLGEAYRPKTETIIKASDIAKAKELSDTNGNEFKVVVLKGDDTLKYG
jgi:hypothetical protein